MTRGSGCRSARPGERARCGSGSEVWGQPATLSACLPPLPLAHGDPPAGGGRGRKNSLPSLPCRWGQRTHLQAWMEAMAPPPLLSTGSGVAVGGVRAQQQQSPGCRVRGASGSSWAFQLRGGSPGPPGSTSGGAVGSTIVSTHCGASLAPPYPASRDTGIATLGCTYR